MKVTGVTEYGRANQSVSKGLDEALDISKRDRAFVSGHCNQSTVLAPSPWKRKT
jgi:uncharacterized protein YggU (UPF0235/DUF167 family)